MRREGGFGKVFAPATNALTVSTFLLSSCAVFAGEQHAIPAVSACNRRASTQPCEFGAGHAFQSFPQDQISDVFRVDAIVKSPIALPTASGLPYHRRPNGSASEIRSTPR